MEIFVSIEDATGKYLADFHLPFAPRVDEFIEMNNDKLRQIILAKWKQNPEGVWYLKLTVQA